MPTWRLHTPSSEGHTVSLLCYQPGVCDSRVQSGPGGVWSLEQYQPRVCVLGEALPAKQPTQSCELRTSGAAPNETWQKVSPDKLQPLTSPWIVTAAGCPRQPPTEPSESSRNCVPRPNSRATDLTPAPQIITAFGTRVFKEVFKLK